MKDASTYKQKNEKVKTALETVHTLQVPYTKNPSLEYDDSPTLTTILQFMAKNPLSPNPAIVISQNKRRTASTITIGKGSNRLERNRKTFAPT